MTQNFLPEKEYTIPGTSLRVILRAWSMFQIEQAKARGVAEGDKYDGTNDLWGQVLNVTGREPVWSSAKAMKDALSLGQMVAISQELLALTQGGVDLAAFRAPGAEAGNASAAPDGESLRGAALADPTREG